MRRGGFFKLGRTLALAAMAWLVVLSTVHVTLVPGFAKAAEAEGLALALQEICSATGLRKSNDTPSPSPAKTVLSPCTLCYALGHLPLGLAGSGPEATLPLASAALPTARLHQRPANALLVGRPPSRAPPSLHA
ncbi:MAG: hypothetical protein J4G10_02695 [Alphaproteobacteria bacterium]|nr:hypothetical protein [Alphaproteobacteria bacterium]